MSGKQLKNILKMIKLALIGKNIQHSRSPEIYRRHLGSVLHYDLLDYENDSQIPSAQSLFAEYNGISITSPYKKHFLNEIELTSKAKELGAINCMKISNGKVIGENTDYLAIIDILKKRQQQYGPLHIFILGDGVMSKVTEAALKQLSIPYNVFSRKMFDDFDHINLKEKFQRYSVTNQKVVINTCAREFIFKGEIDSDAIFWDYNYNFSPHFSSLPAKVKEYCDGYEMLELQAQHALAFWSIIC